MISRFCLSGHPPARYVQLCFNPTIVEWFRRSSKRIREGLTHLNFCIELCKIQINGGRYFLHEHPQGAWSWRTPDILSLMRTPGVGGRVGDMCRHGMVAANSDGPGLVRKPTGWLSNSSALLDELALRCTGHPHHVPLQGRLAREAAIYPQQLCF